MTGEFCIVSWSGVHKATANYPCKLCGGVIPRGTVYRSFVISNDRKDPKRNAYRVQHHLDCDLPWYQPSDVHRLHYVGRIPHAPPPAEERDERLTNATIMPLRYHSERVGTITWELPENFVLRLLYMKSIEEQTAAIYQMRMAVAGMAEAVVANASHQRKSREFNKVVYDVQSWTSLTPHEYDWGIPEPVVDGDDE